MRNTAGIAASPGSGGSAADLEPTWRTHVGRLRARPQQIKERNIVVEEGKIFFAFAVRVADCHECRPRPEQAHSGLVACEPHSRFGRRWSRIVFGNDCLSRLVAW